jgi:hypothetical protein
MDTLDELEAIRARHEADSKWNGPFGDDMQYDMFNDRATLLRLLDAALEEIATWHSVFPDIAPDRVLPNRSKLEAELDAAREELKALKRSQALDELVAISQEAGLYDDPILIDADERTTVRIFTPLKGD